MGGSDRADLLLLKSAQQLGLQVERKLADLVQEDRAPSAETSNPSLARLPR